MLLEFCVISQIWEATTAKQMMIDCHYYIHYPYFLLLEGYCVALVCCCAVWWQGVGTVVSGTTLRGHIKLGDTLLLGPDSTGQFQSIVIKSIHRKRMPVREVKAGQTASFALKKVLFHLHFIHFVPKYYCKLKFVCRYFTDFVT